MCVSGVDIPGQALLNGFVGSSRPDFGALYERFISIYCPYPGVHAGQIALTRGYEPVCLRSPAAATGYHRHFCRTMAGVPNHPANTGAAHSPLRPFQITRYVYIYCGVFCKNESLYIEHILGSVRV